LKQKDPGFGRFSALSGGVLPFFMFLSRSVELKTGHLLA
jgi:hypothetical protein